MVYIIKKTIKYRLLHILIMSKQTMKKLPSCDKRKKELEVVLALTGSKLKIRGCYDTGTDRIYT